MRIVIDLQGAQAGSRSRGIGRYSLALAKALVRNRGEHEIIIALNDLLPDSIEPLRLAFEDLLPAENIRVWHAPGPVFPVKPENSWRRHAAELLRENFLASLRPDVLLISHMFEGFDDDAVHSVGLNAAQIPTAVILYDLIPLIEEKIYLTPHPLYESFYREKLGYLKRADLYLAISESCRCEALQHLGTPPERVTNIAAAVDDHFKQMHITPQDESAIRARFKLTRPFLMYSGATDQRKNHLRLIKAFSCLPTAIKAAYQLAIVGPMPQAHRTQFEECIKECGLTFSDVVITGRVSDDEMVHLYNLCALFVFPSWHEGFGLPALEAMSCGAPVIGSNTTSIPEVIGRSDALFNPFSEVAIAEKITEVLGNDRLRNDLARHGLIQAKKFSWDQSAMRAIAAFEQFHAAQTQSGFKTESPRIDASTAGATTAAAAEAALIESIARLDNRDVSAHDWLRTALSISQNSPPSRKKQILVDISMLVQVDAKSGIQRTLRSILTALLNDPPDGFTVEAVYAKPNERGYQYARRFSAKSLCRPESGLDDEPVEPISGDIFIGIDLVYDAFQQADFYAHMRRIGGQVYFVVHDLLPVYMPEHFPEDLPSKHVRWLETMAQTDGAICVSRVVADSVEAWLTVFGAQRVRPFKLGWFHLGADVGQSVPTEGLPDDAEYVLKALSSRPSFVSVGTIEPRKGQKQTLAAFEMLWKQGSDVNLVIVGKQGWNVESLVDAMSRHAERNKRLFWLPGISDEYLDAVYAASSCLIFASEGEGFGLPMIEAAQHKLPIVARDIPVFREVAGEHAFYFSGLTPTALANSVKQWLSLKREGSAPRSDNMPWSTWKQSAQNFLQVLLMGDWYKQWMPDDIRRFWGSDTRLRTRIGKRIGLMMETTGEPGCLLYGPYIAMTPGKYRIAIYGRVGKGGTAGARRDVAFNQGKRTLGEALLCEPDEHGCMAMFEILLNVSCQDFECRVWVEEQTDLSVSMIIFEPFNDAKDMIERTERKVNRQHSADSVNKIAM